MSHSDSDEETPETTEDNEETNEINELINQSNKLSLDEVKPDAKSDAIPDAIPDAKPDAKPDVKPKLVTIPDKYTKEVLNEQYKLHYNYVKSRKDSSKKLNVKFRFPSIPEDISENIIKFIIHKLGDTTSSWNCKGDLLSEKEGVQECKCFTSTGPLSFTPSSKWDVIYFLDATNWLDNKFILYKTSVKRTSDEWKNIKINKTQTFEDQCVQKRRPRITWHALYPQITAFCEKIYESTFDDILDK